MTSATPEEQANGLVTLFLDDRIEKANEPPGLREAIVDRLAGQVNNIGKRFQEQIGNLRSPSAQRIPNAYLADEEVVENELQACAAGIRTARALEGVLSDARRFEHTLARRLAPNMRWALRSEASRVPRPPTRASVLDWSLTPVPWVEDDAEWPPAGAVALADVRQLTGADPSLSYCCGTWDERVLLMRSGARQDDRDSDDDPLRPGRHDGAGWSGDR